MVKLLGIFISSGTQRPIAAGEMIGGRYPVVNGLQSARPLPIISTVTLYHLNVVEVAMSSLPLLFKKKDWLKSTKLKELIRAIGISIAQSSSIEHPQATPLRSCMKP